MEESTRSKVSFDHLEEAIVKITSHQLSLSENLNNMTLKLDELIHKIQPRDFPSPSPSSSTAIPSLTTVTIPHRIKLDVPRFDGTNPLGWIFKVNQFFAYHETPEAERLTIASFYMEGHALAWFQWMTGNGQFTSWPTFPQALQTRFTPLQY